MKVFSKVVFLMVMVVSIVCAEKPNEADSMSLPPTSTSEATPTSFYPYNNRMVVFNLARLSYERIKSDSVYVGIDAWITWSITNTNSFFHPRNFSFIGDIELLLGYNYLFSGRNHLTPVIGVGAFKDFRSYHQYTYEYNGYYYSHHSKSYHCPSVIYGTFGFLFDHEFNSVFNLGVDLKALIGGAPGGKLWGNPVFGFDVTIPITLRFGQDRHWEFRFEPYDIYLHGSWHDSNYFGCRCTFAYRY